MAGAALVPVERKIGSTRALGETNDLVGRDDDAVDLGATLRRHRLVDERPGDEGGVARRTGHRDRLARPGTDLVGGIHIGSGDDREAPEQGGPEAQLLGRERVECVFQTAHARKVGHERGDPQVGPSLGPRA